MADDYANPKLQPMEERTPVNRKLEELGARIASLETKNGLNPPTDADLFSGDRGMMAYSSPQEAKLVELQQRLLRVERGGTLPKSMLITMEYSVGRGDATMPPEYRLDRDTPEVRLQSALAEMEGRLEKLGANSAVSAAVERPVTQPAAPASMPAPLAIDMAVIAQIKDMLNTSGVSLPKEGLKLVMADLGQLSPPSGGGERPSKGAAK